MIKSLRTTLNSREEVNLYLVSSRIFFRKLFIIKLLLSTELQVITKTFSGNRCDVALIT